MVELSPYLESFLPYAQKKIGFNRPPTIYFDSDSENAQQVLGKTGYYDPDALEIVIFVDNRHPKDVLRSLSHELVHHAQNCRGDLNAEISGEMGIGYAQDNPHMREMEREAYERGNLCFRDWEDSVKIQISLKLQLQETNYLHIKGDNHKMATYDKLQEQIRAIVRSKLKEAIKNPGKYAGGAKQKAGVDDDGDGVPDGADSDPNDGSVQERKKRDTPRDSSRLPPARLKISEVDAEAEAIEETDCPCPDKELEERKRRASERNRSGRREDVKLKPLEEAVPEEDPEDAKLKEVVGGKSRYSTGGGAHSEEYPPEFWSASGEEGEEPEEEEESLDEWYNRGLYEKLLSNWAK